MKKNNKGFSLVELIIVIAIMAILAGALAPALIKYINKSRRSTDIQNADSLRTAIQTALSSPEAGDDCGKNKSASTITSTKLNGGNAVTGFVYTSTELTTDGNNFTKEVHSVVGNNKITTKYKNKGNDMNAIVDVNNNIVIVYTGSGSTAVELSPSAQGDWAN